MAEKDRYAEQNHDEQNVYLLAEVAIRESDGEIFIIGQLTSHLCT